MPSGFQLDNNQLSPGYYRVVIEMGANSPQASWSGTDNAPYDGKVTPYTWDACAYSSVTNLFNDTNQYITDALARGNLRFQAIVETLGLVGDCQILDIETYADDDIDNQADNGWLAFTVKYDRPAFIGPAYNKIQEQDNALDNDYANNSSGTTILEGVTYPNYWSASDEETTINVDAPQDCIRDLVWRALARPTWSRSTRVFDVAKEEGVQTVIEVGNPTDGSDSWLMWEDISVQEINGTTNTITAD